MKKNCLLIVLALSGALILTGCAPEPGPQNTATPSPTVTLPPPSSSTPEPSPSVTTPPVTPKPVVSSPVIPSPEPEEEIPQPEPISTVDGEVELLSTMKPYDGPTPLLDLADSVGMELEYPVGTYLKAYENFEKDPDDSSAYWKIVPENTKYVDVYNSDQDFESRTWNASQIYFRDKGTTEVTFYNIKTNDKIVFTFVIK